MTVLELYPMRGRMTNKDRLERLTRDIIDLVWPELQSELPPLDNGHVVLAALAVSGAVVIAESNQTLRQHFAEYFQRAVAASFTEGHA